MPLKGALVGWLGSSRESGGIKTGADMISLSRFPENWMENLWLARQRYQKRPAPPKIDRRDLPAAVIPTTGKLTVPVGVSAPGRVPQIIPVPSIPKIRQPIRVADIKEPPKIAGGTKTPNPPFFPGTTTPVPKLNPRILNPPIIRPKETKGPLDVLIDLIKPNITTKVQPVALDLGNLLDTGLRGYIDYKTTQAQPVYDPRGFIPFSGVPLNQYGYAGPEVAAPGAATSTCLPPGYKFDKCGNVVKTRRRRRRRLATSSDIKDLAALSSVTTGPEKKTWIATHPS